MRVNRTLPCLCYFLDTTLPSLIALGLFNPDAVFERLHSETSIFCLLALVIYCSLEKFELNLLIFKNIIVVFLIRKNKRIFIRFIHQKDFRTTQIYIKNKRVKKDLSIHKKIKNLLCRK